MKKVKTLRGLKTPPHVSDVGNGEIRLFSAVRF